MPRRWLADLACGAVCLSSVGCEVAETAAPAVEQRALVHAVLNPGSNVQTIIVERTLNSVSVTPGGQPPYEPIGDARVVVYGPRDDSVVAARATGTGTVNGVYRLSSITITDGSAGTAGPNVLRLRPGERYRLRVQTSLGLTSGETIIPVGGPVDALRRTFNVDHDTLLVNLANVRAAAGFYLRHETANALHERYVTLLKDPLLLPLVPLSGGTTPAWEFSFAHESVFPGITQRFSVVAVDSNYFRYYVAAFDPFGDDTRGNTLTGGVGLFGAVATILTKTLDLTADIDTPIEGTWTADRASTTLPITMSLYSSPYFPSEQFGQRVSLSGTGRISGSGANVEAYGWTEGIGATVQFFPVGQGQIATASGSMSGADLVLTDQRTGERLTYRKR